MKTDCSQTSQGVTYTKLSIEHSGILISCIFKIVIIFHGLYLVLDWYISLAIVKVEHVLNLSQAQEGKTKTF